MRHYFVRRRDIGFMLILAAVPLEFLWYLAYEDHQFCNENLNAVTPHPPDTRLECSGPDIRGWFALVVAMNAAGAVLVIESVVVGLRSRLQ